MVIFYYNLVILCEIIKFVHRGTGEGSNGTDLANYTSLIVTIYYPWILPEFLECI